MAFYRRIGASQQVGESVASHLLQHPDECHFLHQDCCNYQVSIVHNGRSQSPVLWSYKAQRNDVHRQSVSSKISLGAESFGGEFGNMYSKSKGTQTIIMVFMVVLSEGLHAASISP